MPSFYSKSDIANGIKKPNSSRAKEFYTYAYDKANYENTVSVANKAFHDLVKKNGYNMLPDLSDRELGISKYPVIILNPKNNVEISGKRIVDKVSRTKAKDALRDVRKLSTGKEFITK